MPRSRALLWFTVLYLGFWGGAIGVLAKWAMEAFTPIQLIFVRLVVSSAIVAAILAAKGKLTATLKQIVLECDYYALLAVTGVGVAMVLGFLGLKLTTAISYDLLFNTAGLFMVLLGSLMYGERVGRRDKWLLAVAFAGTALLVLRGGAAAVAGGSLLGDALVVLGAFGWAFYTVYGSHSARLDARHDALTNVFGSFLLAAVVMTPYILHSEPINLDGSFKAISAALVLSVFATAFLFVLWFKFSEVSDGASIALVSLSENLGGVILPIIFLGESLTLATVLGGAMIIVPIAIREYIASVKEVNNESQN